MAIQVLVPLPEKADSFCCRTFLLGTGLERAAPVRTLVQKLRAGEQFLARGKVHGLLAAVGMTVDGNPF